MAIESGGGSSRSPYASLVQVLRGLLGSLYDDGPNELRDQATLNLARLQIIAPPSAAERQRIEEAVPGDLRDYYKFVILNRGGRTATPGTLDFGGAKVNFNEFWDGVQAQVRDDNIDRTTVQDVINARDAGVTVGGDMEFGGGVTQGTGPTSPFGGGTTQGTVQTAQSGTTTAPGGSTGGSGGSGGGGAGGGGWAGDSSLPAEGTGRQIPGGEQLWNVDGDIYLAYSNPRQPDLWMVWHVENPDRLNAIYGDNMPAFDRTLSRDEFKRLSPWFGGASAELANKSEDPWTQFNYDFKEAAKLRPWLNDPSMQAVMQGAYLEGRAPTKDELSQTDWWNEHTADERAWLEESVTLGRDELARRKEDAARAVGDALRQAGINNAPRRVVEFIAEQRLTGKWSESYASEQVRKLADPFAPGRLDSALKDVLDGDELDTTRKFEEEVRQLATTWLGPTMGRMGERELSRWAGRFRNDPDAQVEFVEKLRQQRLALFPGYENPNLTYEDIVQPVRNLATNVWGQAVTDEEMLVDLANTRDYTEMATRLRRQGRKKGVRKVWQDMLGAAGETPVGERVVQSAI